MNISLLFNSDDPKYGGYYGPPIRNAVFGLGLIQGSGRHMKVSIGDVLIYSKVRTWEDYDALTNATYFTDTWSLLFRDRLEATFRKATVYALTFENMTLDLAEQLHDSLSPDPAYFGALEVDYSYGVHLALFRNSMITNYRVQGTMCRVFFSMGEDDGKDHSELDAMKSLGYRDVDWEDKGAHGTIFDDFDTLEHFQQIAIFQRQIETFLPEGTDGASELIMVLEDLNPRLFNELGSAAAALERARHEADIAQVAISGRRFIEKLADTLFPPSPDPYKGHDVGKTKYRSRLWAYISDHAHDKTEVDLLGKEMERLDSEFNAGLHGNRDKPRIQKVLAETAVFTATVLSLNPNEARKPYYAYESNIMEFFRETLLRQDDISK